MMLPDVNVWLASAWARHAKHPIAKHWVDEQDAEMAFCRVTEMALLRLVTNPAVTGTDARTRRQAWDLLEQLEADPRVRFLADRRALRRCGWPSPSATTPVTCSGPATTWRRSPRRRPPSS